MGIKVYKNVLPDDLIKEVFTYLDNNSYRNVWRQSIYWTKNLKANNPTALTLSDLPIFMATPIIEHFQKLDKKYSKYKCHCIFYIWPPMSHIGWHNDDKWEVGASIYLNKEWNRNDGGLFLYTEKGQNKFIIPEYNMCVVNEGHTDHAVSALASHGPHRLSLQIFCEK